MEKKDLDTAQQEKNFLLYINNTYEYRQNMLE